MDAYFSVKVDIDTESGWYNEIEKILGDLISETQKSFHITLAFFKKVPKGMYLEKLLDNDLQKVSLPTLVFDTPDVFTTKSNDFHIVNVKCSEIPEDLLSLVNFLRQKGSDYGCKIDNDFRLHVTLFKVPVSKIKLEDLKKMVSSVKVGPFPIPLKALDYREFAPKKRLLATWPYGTIHRNAGKHKNLRRH